MFILTRFYFLFLSDYQLLTVQGGKAFETCIVTKEGHLGASIRSIVITTMNDF